MAQVPLARVRPETILRRFCAILLGTWCVMHGRGQPRPWAASPQKGDFHDENPFYPSHGRSGRVALALLTGAGAAQARDVNWSIGVNSPGVSVGVSNGYGYPVYVAPPPVYVAPRPIYYAPPPPRVYYAPPPAVYYAPPPGHYYREGHRGHRHHRHHGDRDWR